MTYLWLLRGIIYLWSLKDVIYLWSLRGIIYLWSLSGMIYLWLLSGVICKLLLILRQFNDDKYNCYVVITYCTVHSPHGLLTNSW